MKFELPSNDGVIGLTPKMLEELNRDKQKVLDFMHMRATRMKAGLELEKTERDIEIIKFATNSLKEYLREYGREIIEIPLEYIHILKDGGTEELTEGRSSGGAHGAVLTNIITDRNSSDIQFVLILFHELLHQYSFNTLQIATDENGKREIEEFRSGFNIITRNGDRAYFSFIDEALQTILERRFYVEKVQKNSFFESFGEKQEVKFSRDEELEEFNELLDDLYQRNKEDFTNREEILNLFFQAKLNGHLLPVARLIEKSYGKGSFRRLGKTQV